MFAARSRGGGWKKKSPCPLFHRLQSLASLASVLSIVTLCYGITTVSSLEHGDNLDQSMTTVVIRVLPVLKSALSLTSPSWRLLAGATSSSTTSSPPSHLSDHTHTNTHTTSTNKFNFRGELELELSVSGAPAQRLTAILVPRYTHLSRYPGIPTLISRYTGIQVFGSHSKSGINLPKQRE